MEGAPVVTDLTNAAQEKQPDQEIVESEPQISSSGSILGMPEAHEIKFFKSSELPQPKAVTEFLTKSQKKNAFNKYCIDCKKSHSTHVLVWLGIFVCEQCAQMHQRQNGRRPEQSKYYVKSVLNEQWDDYQLKSVQVGGNEQWFKIMKEYDILDLEFAKKYKHPALHWFKKRHLAKIEELEFTTPQPPKDWNERKEMTKKTLATFGDKFQKKLLIENEKAAESSVKFSIAVDQKAKALYEKHKEKSWAKKLSKAIGGKVSTHNRAPSMEQDFDQIGQQQNSDRSKESIQEEQKAETVSTEDIKVSTITESKPQTQ